MTEFEMFPKISRLRREAVITEKIDGTNAAIIVTPERVTAQSRKRLITPEDDNFGFARWVAQNADELGDELGEGRHFGEWWGLGIQRGYGQTCKRFSLFNTHRWGDLNSELLDVVPVLAHGMFTTDLVETALKDLEATGSKAAPGFRNPEGVVVFHHAANMLFKVTIFGDAAPKSQQ